MHDLAQEVLLHLKATWRYRWYAVAVAWLVAMGGWLFVYKMPNRYEADARVHVDTQSILRPLLQGLAVQPNLEQMVVLMSRTLVSRPNLEKVIDMSGLDHRVRSEADRLQMISELSNTITIKSAGKENLYTISYTDQDPEIAKRVVESLLTLFMQAGTKDNRKDSDSAQRFIDEQLEVYREKLLESENAMSTFKRRHLGMMPGAGPGYFARLEEAKTTLNRSVLELKEAENSRDSIKRQLDKEIATPAASGKAAEDKPKLESELDSRLRALGQKLDQLRTTYTDEHPDIVATLRIIEQLKEQKEIEMRAEAEARARDPKPVVIESKSPLYQQLTISLTAADASVAAMRTRVAAYSQRYADLQASANAFPQIEAEYTELTRDYEVNKARYDELLKRRESARMSGDMESSDAATAFRVIDPPQVPLTPNAPNRPQLMTMVLLAALGAGLGVAFLISQLMPTFGDERHLRQSTGLPVLGTIVMTRSEPQLARRRRGLVALFASVAGLFSAYAAIMATIILTTAKV